jgi:hypothetical protein
MHIFDCIFSHIGWYNLTGYHWMEYLGCSPMLSGLQLVHAQSKALKMFVLDYVHVMAM